MGDFIEQVQCEELIDDRIFSEQDDSTEELEMMELPPWTDLIWD